MSTPKGKKLLIIHQSPECLKLTPKNLNEADGMGGEYIFEGTFGVINDVPNRNGRIYTESEYLPHIVSLRNRIKKGEQILGEVEHPEDRFRNDLNFVSHEILDVWYDKPQKRIMGKLRLLTTPKGQILRSLVNDGINLFVSSRAMGSVNPDKTVKISEIFTWDIVARPGFAEASISRVNESEFDAKVSSLYESIDGSKKVHNNQDQSIKYGILNESVKVYEINEANPTTGLTSATQLPDQGNSQEILDKINKVRPGVNPFEDDVTKETSSQDIDTADLDNLKKEIKEEILDELQGSKKKSGDDLFTNIEIVTEEPLFKNAEIVEEPSEESKKSSKASENKKDSKDLEDKSKKIEASMKELDDEFERVVKGSKEKKKLEESVKNNYTWTSNLNKTDFNHFMSLTESEKSTMDNYVRKKGLQGKLLENAGTSMYSPYKEVYINAIKMPQPENDKDLWLVNAPTEYKSLYRKLPKDKKEAVAKRADRFIFESKDDVNSFWYDLLLGGYLQKELSMEMKELSESMHTHKDVNTVGSYNHSGLNESVDIEKENEYLDQLCESFKALRGY